MKIEWDKWTKITVYGAFIQVWVFIIALTAISASVEAARVVNSCSDSDGGNVITVFGTVSGYYKNKPYSYSDYCVSQDSIREYYCNGKYQTSSQYSCGTDRYNGDYYCLNGDVYRDYWNYYCSGGVCALNVTPIMQQDCVYGCLNGGCTSPPANSCNDTDGGYAVTVQGTVSGYQSGIPYSYTDSCNSTIILNEWYCSGTSPGIYQYYCSMNYTSCVSGACM